MEAQRFLEEYQVTDINSDPLPIKVLRNTITKKEIVGQAFFWGFEYLDQRSCPHPLMYRILGKLISELPGINFSHCSAESATGNSVEVDGYSPEEPDAPFAPLKLMQAIVKKVDAICLKEREDLHDSVDGIVESPDLLPHVYAVSYHNIKNTRRFMEDRMTVLPRMDRIFNLSVPISYFAVFDGHNGSEAAAYGAAQLHQCLITSMRSHEDMISCINDAFENLDEAFVEKCRGGKVKSGSTAVLGLLMPSKLYVGWVGDSQAVLVKRGEICNLVVSHKPERKDEEERIKSLGGEVFNMNGTCRVNGNLAVSRAIGDADDKTFIIATPDIKMMELDGTEEFLILACDGLWDEVTPELAAHVVRRQVVCDPNNANAISQKLVQSAKQRGSTDNITVIVVFLEPMESIRNRYENNLTNDFETEVSVTKQPLVTPESDSSEKLIELNGHGKEAEALVDFLSFGSSKESNGQMPVDDLDGWEKVNRSGDEDNDDKDVDELSDEDADDEWQFQKPTTTSVNNHDTICEPPLVPEVTYSNEQIGGMPVSNVEDTSRSPVQQSNEETLTLMNAHPTEMPTESFNPFTTETAKELVEDVLALAVPDESAKQEDAFGESRPVNVNEDFGVQQKDGLSGDGYAIKNQDEERRDPAALFGDGLFSQTKETGFGSESFNPFAEGTFEMATEPEKFEPQGNQDIVLNPFQANVNRPCEYRSEGILATFEVDDGRMAEDNLVQIETNPLPEDLSDMVENAEGRYEHQSDNVSNPFSLENSELNNGFESSEDVATLAMNQSNPFGAEQPEADQQFAPEGFGIEMVIPAADVFVKEAIKEGAELGTQLLEEQNLLAGECEQFPSASPVPVDSIEVLLAPPSSTDMPVSPDNSQAGFLRQQEGPASLGREVRCEMEVIQEESSRDLEAPSLIDASTTGSTQASSASPEDMQEVATSIPATALGEILEEVAESQGTGSSPPKEFEMDSASTERENAIQASVEQAMTAAVDQEKCQLVNEDSGANQESGTPLVVKSTTEFETFGVVDKAEEIKGSEIFSAIAENNNKVLPSFQDSLIDDNLNVCVSSGIDQATAEVSGLTDPLLIQTTSTLPIVDAQTSATVPPIALNGEAKNDHADVKPASLVKSSESKPTKTAATRTSLTKTAKTPTKAEPATTKPRPSLSTATAKKSPSKPATETASKPGLAPSVKSSTSTARTVTSKPATTALKTGTGKVNGAPSSGNAAPKPAASRITAPPSRPATARPARDAIDPKTTAARPTAAMKARPTTAPSTVKPAPPKLETASSPKRVTATAPSQKPAATRAVGEVKSTTSSASAGSLRPKPSTLASARSPAKPDSKPAGVEVKKAPTQPSATLAAKSAALPAASRAPRSVARTVPTTSKPVPTKPASAQPATTKPAAAARVGLKNDDKLQPGTARPMRVARAAPPKAAGPLKKVDSVIKGNKPAAVDGRPKKVLGKTETPKSDLIEQNGIAPKKEEEANAVNEINGDPRGETEPEKQDAMKENGVADLQEEASPAPAQIDDLLG